MSDSQVDLPLDGDEYDDELEALLSYDADSNSSDRDEGRGRRGRRRHRS